MFFFLQLSEKYAIFVISRQELNSELRRCLKRRILEWHNIIHRITSKALFRVATYSIDNFRFESNSERHSAQDEIFYCSSIFEFK